MDQRLLYFLLLATLLHPQLPLILMAQVQPPLPTSHITVQGSVFCDVCYDNTFSRHSYFLPGANVHIQCKFKANSPGTTEQMAFSVNRTADRYGVYKLDIPSIEGVDCAEGPEIQFVCEVGLIGSASPAACNVPGRKSTTNEITLKSKQSNLCIYSMGALSSRPVSRNVSLCGNKKFGFPYAFNSSKFFLPNFPPYYGIHWPPLPQFPPLPSLPPFPFSPLPPLPSLPPLPPLPSLPPLPPLPSLPPFPFPPATIPRPPTSSSVFPSNPPPNYPFLSPPRPPGFNLADPRTWIPNYPPSPPSPPQQLQP